MLHRESKLIHHRLRFCCDSFFTCIFLRSFRHHFNTFGGIEMADVEQTQKMIPFITCENSLCQYVGEMVLGVNVFDLARMIFVLTTRPAFEAHPGADSLWSHISTGPSASRNTFSVSTITDGNSRIGGRSTFPALTLA